MLNDAERRRLEEIESVLRADDPAFVHRFEARRGSRRRRLVVAVLALVIALFVTLVSLVDGNILGTVLGLVAAATTVGLWLVRRTG